MAEGGKHISSEVNIPVEMANNRVLSFISEIERDLEDMRHKTFKDYEDHRGLSNSGLGASRFLIGSSEKVDSVDRSDCNKLGSFELYSREGDKHKSSTPNENLRSGFSVKRDSSRDSNVKFNLEHGYSTDCSDSNNPRPRIRQGRESEETLPNRREGLHAYNLPSREEASRDTVGMYNRLYNPPTTATPRPISRLSIGTRPISRREKEPEKFDGKSTDYKDYMVHFEQTATWNGWSDDEKAQQLTMSLRGSAQKILGDLKAEQLKNYEELKKILCQRFNPKERVAAYRCEFRTRIRRQNESLQDYGYALRRLVCLAYPDSDFNYVLEELAINQFTNGLGNFEMQKQVQFSHPKTIESAIAYAVEYEAFVGTQADIRKPKDKEAEFNIKYPVQAVKKQDIDKPKPEECKTQTNASEEALIKVLDYFKEISQKLTQMSLPRNQERHNFRTPIRCYNCGELGHIAVRSRFLYDHSEFVPIYQI
ncbi:unnamed protein product [Mytilus edulis]|uniref:Retrotransposon gag domain-containing protein n=1 Tax=Mytilus edulis TaxID=6550 RepID=A0A8S3UGA6_MYTED|nr:unnamed protein product [Mytilus edulis]